MALHGHGMAANSEEAAVWFRKAAEKNSPDAQLAMGKLYLSGEGVAINGEEAIKLYRASAEQGNSEAQSLLGTVYAEGKHGVVKDNLRAIFWLSKAVRGGSNQAQLLLKKFSSNDLARSGYSVIIVYRPDTFTGGELSYFVFLNDVIVGSIGKRQHLRLIGPPARRIVNVGRSKTSVANDFASFAVTYIRHDSTFAIGSQRTEIVEATGDTTQEIQASAEVATVVMEAISLGIEPVTQQNLDVNLSRGIADPLPSKN
jgi:hypothetical protein